MNDRYIELKNFLKNNAEKILIVTHKDPDFDAIGSVLAVFHQLRNHGKQVRIWNSDFVADDFSFLPGFDQIEINYPQNFDYDTLLVLDCSDISRVRNFEKLRKTGLSMINVDHHADNCSFGTMNITPIISSVGELLFHFFKAAEWPISYDMAICLYVAILFDTGRFQFSSVTDKTFLAASELVQLGVKPDKFSQLIFDNKTVETFDVFRQALNHLCVNEALKFAYTVVDSDMKAAGHEAVDLIRTLRDIEIFIVFRQSDPTTVRINLRSRSWFNVNEFAHEFGGGGHRRASGITIPGHLSEIVLQVISRLEERLKAR